MTEGLTDQPIRYAAEILAAKMLRKCRPNEVPAPVVKLAASCAVGYTYNWADFIAREFLEDVQDAQELRRPFHYSWLLVLIALVGWREPEQTQFVDVPPDMPFASRYASLWYSTNKGLQQLTDYTFAIYSFNILVEIFKNPRIAHELYEQYAGVARFKADMHNLFIQARADKMRSWLKLPYVVRADDIVAAVQSWPEEWMRYEGPYEDIGVPPSPGPGAGPSQPTHSDPPAQSTEQDTSEKTVSDQPGDGEAGGDEQQGAKEE